MKTLLTAISTIAVLLLVGSSVSSVYAEVPSWVKNNAGWWAEGTIDDDSFVQGIQFLIKEGIMSITQVQESEQSVSSVSTSDDSVIASLEAELEKCSEIVKAYKRLDCEKPIKQEILVHTYKTGAELMQVGPINYYWFGVNSEGNTFEISPTGQPILNIRMLADNTSSGIVSLNCTSPSICNYDVWDGSNPSSTLEWILLVDKSI